jgi:hypothetical protein
VSAGEAWEASRSEHILQVQDLDIHVHAVDTVCGRPRQVGQIRVSNILFDLNGFHFAQAGADPLGRFVYGPVVGRHDISFLL